MDFQKLRWLTRAPPKGHLTRFFSVSARRNTIKQTSTTKQSFPSSSTFIFSLVSAAAASAATYYYAKSAFRDESVLRPESINKFWPVRKYGGAAELAQAFPEFQEFLNDRVSTDPEELKRHGYSEWSTINIERNPIAIVYPESTEEVSRIAKICHKYRLPMIGFSGGSSLEGNFSAPHGGICIDFSHMSAILAIRPDDLDATVQPGVGWMDLNQHLKSQGIDLFFPVDPGPIAKIGGMVSTSCSGTNCVRYGPMRDHIVNLTVVLADGTIIKTRGRPRKTSAGYNLNHLFAGSEGTLGLITEITVKLAVVPDRTTVALSTFPSERLATSAAIGIIRAGIPVHCVELMDDVQMWAINKSNSTERKWKEQATLLFKFSGSNAFVDEQIEKARQVASKYQSSSFDFARNDAEAQQIWAARKEALWSSMALGPKDAKIYTTDVAVPMSKLADLIEATKKDLKDSGVAFGSSLGHVGDGNFHASVIYSDTPEDAEVAKKIAENVNYRGLALEGTCTGEHGIGMGKVKYLADELGTDVINVMHTIKMALDPYELLNPGKVFTREVTEWASEKERNGTWGGKGFKLHKFGPENNTDANI
ncbi:uncharacterized protein SAPINGB_P000359 [Magnusiomyces paraingens]|uniref:D-lactate dehydrogenase (cytochrome) n=1 Tax=Magnusiomyces paraingens TaxID=2606893 RepID=A0A5E8AZ52_9ASCO|nr:uncharacterized protein SAPINGB_P000359 [Saprochaete ingens]VVT44267.1 unnamed protein product [Saprochaete ingens]